jgi:hypothetical protein
MAGKMLVTDLMTRNFRSVRVTTDPACPACAAINVPA